jgi:UDP-N-acetylmuramoylalanine--D-glutamate ligase
MELRGKRTLVMGLGVHGGGLGVARFLAEQGAEVTVTDLRSAAVLQESVAALADLPVRLVLGEHREEDFRNAELVVRNPAVPDTSRFLQIARAAGAAIEMEMTLFFRLCPGPILGITGTKGKTTTTMLAGAMLAQHAPDTVVAGNLRVSALAQLPRIGPQTPVVLELSSFALEGLGAAGLSPHYACVTNLSADHLDRYPSMVEYAAAKRHIVAYQRPGDTAILNGDDALVREFAQAAGGRVGFFSAVQPRDAAADAAWFDGDILVAQVAGGTPHAICSADDLALPGRHNRGNLAAAALLARVFGAAPEAIRAAVRGFGGVPHRLETVATIGGARFVNDTAATAPDAAIAALQSFEPPIVLISGGADKNLPFDALAQTIVARAAALVLLAGSATPALQEALARTGSALPVYGPFDDLDAAVATAARVAAPGSVVLLSPGCASFGMFRNEFHRGEAFRASVARLAAGQET